MYNYLSTFPALRLRRTRKNAALRALVSENHLNINDLVMPIFIKEGKNIKEEISSMPGLFRFSIDTLLLEIESIVKLKIPAIAIFPAINKEYKTTYGKYALNEKGIVQEAIKKIKGEFPHLLIIADIALDPYTSHGQDGIIDANGNVLNDETTAVLAEQALSCANAGADIVAPSDMMDGRIKIIRDTLEKNNFPDTCILSYSSKYNSCFYGPFRDAIGTKQALAKASKSTYQMDPANSDEALREVALDLQEGADIVMVKPGMPYLDIIQKIKTTFNCPLAAYQVSGEYSMISISANLGMFDRQAAILESLLAFKRAGSDFIFTYFAKEAAAILNNP